MARIPLGTSGGKMAEVAMGLEGEARADERQKRALRSQTSQFMAQLQQRQAEQRDRMQIEGQQMALTEEREVFNQMAAQMREEGLRQQRSFEQSATNVKLGGEYGAQVKWNQATNQFEPQAVQPGEGFAIGKTAKAQAKAQQLQQQTQNRTAQIMTAYPEFALRQPEAVMALVNSSRTDNQLMDEIGQMSERLETEEARTTLSDQASRPEQVIEALETLQKYGGKTLWDHALEAEVDARVDRIADKNAAHNALEKQKANLVSYTSKAKALASAPSTPFGNEKAIAQAQLASYEAQMKEVNKALEIAETDRLKRIEENPYQKVMADVIGEVYTGASGVHEVHKQWSEQIGNAVQGLQQQSQQAQQSSIEGLTTSQGIAVEGYQPYGQQGGQQGGQQPQQQPQAQPPQQQQQGPPEAQEGASGMKQFIGQEIRRIRMAIEQAETDLAEAEKSGNDRVIFAAKDALMQARREAAALKIQIGLEGEQSLEEPEGSRGRDAEFRQ